MKFDVITRAFHQAGFKIKQHSPEILIGVGVVGVVTSTVMACKATTKASEVLEAHKKDVDQIHKVEELMAAGELEEGTYSEAEAKKDLAIVYTKTAKEMVKLYGPAVLLGAASIGAIIWSHGIMTKRNAALGSALSAVTTGFAEYRKRVVDRYGEKAERDILYNVKAKEIETVELDENGNEVHGKKTIEVVDPDDVRKTRPFSKFFDEASPKWEKSPEYNLMFLRQNETWANERLNARGHLYLNEILEALGIPETKLGSKAGWVKGDYVDFGIYNIHSEAKRDFVNGYMPNVLLDFNCKPDITNEINWNYGC